MSKIFLQLGILGVLVYLSVIEAQRERKHQLFLPYLIFMVWNFVHFKISWIRPARKKFRGMGSPAVSIGPPEKIWCFLKEIYRFSSNFFKKQEGGPLIFWLDIFVPLATGLPWIDDAFIIKKSSNIPNWSKFSYYLKTWVFQRSMTPTMIRNSLFF